MAIRRIYCESCGRKVLPMDPADVANHWQARTIPITAQKPPGHHITVTEYKKGESPTIKRTELSTLLCDLCGHPIPDGSPAIACTAWRGPEPPAWETDYMQKPPTP
jgi:hypothetical protein